jgi:D-glycero-D-manno-heptose 1,7-bisphosphate phosphatase|tara:strand:+ start:84 stop:620 length:537 start_codon:yes stop_codon:yes gene_type:complete
MKKAAFLDRDGVINRAIIKDGKPLSPNTLNELEILPGVIQSITKLKKLNFVCLVVTNQPNVSRKKIDKNSVIQMNNFLKNEIPLDDFFVCYHDDKDNCDCRKPKPGLLLKAGKKWDVDFKKSFMIGDRWRDIEAGKNVGCKTIFLDYKYSETKPKNPSFVSDTLLNAVHIIEKHIYEK